MRVQLMLTCLGDLFYGKTAIASAKLLEACGCDVRFTPEQTCCGQPFFNTGQTEDARCVAERTEAVFAGQVVVTPSCSCAAMLHEGYEKLLGRPPLFKSFELGEFIWRELPPQSLPTSSRRDLPPIGLHVACHARALNVNGVHKEILEHLGAEVVLPRNAEQCCGFGGTFCVTHGELSARIGLEKLGSWGDVSEVLTTDLGCLMHLNGVSDRTGAVPRVRHWTEFAAELLDL